MEEYTDVEAGDWEEVYNHGWKEPKADQNEFNPELEFMEQQFELFGWKDCVANLVGSDSLKPRGYSPDSGLNDPLPNRRVPSTTKDSLDRRSAQSENKQTREHSTSIADKKKSESSVSKASRILNIDQVKIAHIVEQCTSLLAKYLHRLDGIPEMITALKKEVNLLGLVRHPEALKLAVQNIVRHEDFDCSLHRVYGDSKPKVAKIKKAVWKRIVLNCAEASNNRRAKLKKLMHNGGEARPVGDL